MRPRLWAALVSTAAMLGVGLCAPRSNGSSDAAPVGTAELDAEFARRWAAAQLNPAAAAEDRLVLRRLTLALCGTVPSLEELRAFEADVSGRRVEVALARLLTDGRHHRYFAERLARVFVGTVQGAFVVYRRDRLVEWLTEQLARNRPWDAVVRDLVSSSGLWTSEPATNFVTSAVVEGKVDPEQLAGRTMRAVLGERMDCAQCHDHPFGDATQQQFKQLAAFYEGLEVSGLGVSQGASLAVVGVPYGEQWLPSSGAPRARLAGWLTDARNRRFARATANRVWGLVVGRPLVTPVDDLPAPPEGAPDALELLASDFVASGHDLRRLITRVALSAPARLSSELPHSANRALLEREWAVFPLTPLRPEQLVGALVQAASVRTIDLDSHVLTRLVRLLREKEFVEEYGESSADELSERSGTVGQALLRMNGKLPQDLVEMQPFGAVGRVLAFAATDELALQTLYLSFLSRAPNPAETAALLPMLAADRGGEDVAWALFNSPEFAWNH